MSDENPHGSEELHFLQNVHESCVDDERKN